MSCDLTWLKTHFRVCVYDDSTVKPPLSSDNGEPL